MKTKQVIVYRRDLGMRKGKIAAQYYAYARRGAWTTNASTWLS